MLIFKSRSHEVIGEPVMVKSRSPPGTHRNGLSVVTDEFGEHGCVLRSTSTGPFRHGLVTYGPQSYSHRVEGTGRTSH